MCTYVAAPVVQARAFACVAADIGGDENDRDEATSMHEADAHHRIPRVPSSSAVLSAMRATGSSSSSSDRSPGTIVAVAQRLSALHARRAGLVSARREPDVSDHHVAACVHMIDEIDCARAELVVEIDRYVARLVSGHAPVVHTETLGAVVDRLAQLFATMNTIAAVDNSDHEHRSACAVAELALAYDSLVADLSAGHRRVPQW